MRSASSFRASGTEAVPSRKRFVNVDVKVNGSLYFHYLGRVAFVRQPRRACKARPTYAFCFQLSGIRKSNGLARRTIRGLNQTSVAL